MAAKTLLQFSDHRRQALGLCARALEIFLMENGEQDFQTGDVFKVRQYLSQKSRLRIFLGTKKVKERIFCLDRGKHDRRQNLPLIVFERIVPYNNEKVCLALDLERKCFR